MIHTATMQRLLLSATSALVLSSAPSAVYAQNNTIYACVTKTTGAVRIVATASSCKNGESPLSWNIQGPIGPQGPTGPQGPIGLTGPTGPQGPAGSAFPTTCPADSVLVGTTCVDTYEASVWQIPSGSTALIAKVKNGTATLADLQAGGFQKGATVDDYSCNDNGNDCTDLYAASVSGVTPSANLTWFQAQQFCRAAGKRLLTNAEWQSAAAGTPDGAPCVVNASGAGLTGTAGCVSNAGAFDMVGNLDEWVGDWMPRSTDCGSWGFSDDFQCLAGAATSGEPGALVRGGGFVIGTGAGVFAVNGDARPSGASALAFGAPASRPTLALWPFGLWGRASGESRTPARAADDNTNLRGVSC